MAELINRMHRIYNAGAQCTSVNVDLIDDCLIKKVKEQKNIGHWSPLYFESIYIEIPKFGLLEML